MNGYRKEVAEGVGLHEYGVPAVPGGGILYQGQNGLPAFMKVDGLRDADTGRNEERKSGDHREKKNKADEGEFDQAH